MPAQPMHPAPPLPTHATGGTACPLRSPQCGRRLPPSPQEGTARTPVPSARATPRALPAHAHAHNRREGAPTLPHAPHPALPLHARHAGSSAPTTTIGPGFMRPATPAHSRRRVGAPSLSPLHAGYATPTPCLQAPPLPRIPGDAGGPMRPPQTRLSPQLSASQPHILEVQQVWRTQPPGGRPHAKRGTPHGGGGATQARMANGGVAPPPRACNGGCARMEGWAHRSEGTKR
ncbi:hypothetical protein EDB83DRAFT_2453309, partial [Lactarius deliciosus]